MTCTGALSFPFHSHVSIPCSPSILRLVMFSVVLAHSFATSKLENSIIALFTKVGAADFFDHFFDRSLFLHPPCTTLRTSKSW